MTAPASAPSRALTDLVDLADAAMQACVRLLSAGCHVTAAHAHAELAVGRVDRRPPLDELTAVSLRACRSGRYYRGALGPVVVEWQEPCRGRGRRAPR